MRRNGRQQKHNQQQQESPFVYAAHVFIVPHSYENLLLNTRTLLWNSSSVCRSPKWISAKDRKTDRVHAGIMLKPGTSSIRNPLQRITMRATLSISVISCVFSHTQNVSHAKTVTIGEKTKPTIVAEMSA